MIPRSPDVFSSSLLKCSNNREWWIFIYSAPLLPFLHAAGIILNRKWAKRASYTRLSCFICLLDCCLNAFAEWITFSKWTLFRILLLREYFDIKFLLNHAHAHRHTDVTRVYVYVRLINRRNVEYLLQARGQRFYYLNAGFYRGSYEIAKFSNRNDLLLIMAVSLLLSGFY